MLPLDLSGHAHHINCLPTTVLAGGCAALITALDLFLPYQHG